MMTSLKVYFRGKFMDKEKDRDYEKEAEEKLDKWLKEVGLNRDANGMDEIKEK